MTDHFDSPSFPLTNEKLQSSLVNATLERTSQQPAYNPPVSQHPKYDPTEYGLSKHPENLGSTDLSQKLVEQRSQRPSQRESQSIQVRDYGDDFQKPSIDVLSPSSNPYYQKPGQYSNYTTAPSGRTYYGAAEPESIRYMPQSTKSTFEGPVGDRAAYSRLENEIINLKKALQERFDKPEPAKELKGTKKRSKIEAELANREISDDEDSSILRMENKRQKSRGKEALAKEAKSFRNTLLAKNVKTTPKGKPAHDETIGKRTDTLKDEKKTTDKRATSKLKGGETRSKGKFAVEEKYELLKGKYKELKEVCREYIEKAQDLEEILKSKDAQLEFYENEIRKKHDLLQEKVEVINEYKRQLANKEEKIERITKDYELKFKEQEERLERTQHVAKEKEKAYKAERGELFEENKKLALELEEITKKEASATQKKQALRDEVEILKSEVSAKAAVILDLTKIDEAKGQELVELKSELRRIKIENDELRDRNRELDLGKREAEDAHSRDKRLYEDHLKQLADERERETNKQKEKLESLKDELKKAWSSTDTLKEEKEALSVANERLDRHKGDVEEDLRKTKEKLRQSEKDKEILEREVERIKLQKDEAGRDLGYETEKATRFETENRRLEIALKTVEGKLSVKEKEAEQLQEINDTMRDEMKGLLEEVEKTRDYAVKKDKEFDSLTTSYNEELANLERKTEKLAKEIQLLNEENRILKVSEGRLNRELNATREEKDRYRMDYRELRETNKTLEKDLKELDEKVKDVISTKRMDIQDQSRELGSFRQSNTFRQSNFKQLPSATKQSGSKLKVLDEIQDMIKGYRLTQDRFGGQE